MFTHPSSTVFKLLRAAAALTQRLDGALGSLHGLSVNEAMLLMILEASPLNRASRIDLARRLYLSASTVTRMARPLEKLGMVTREPDPRDARLAYVALTDAGRERIAEARATVEARATELFRDRFRDGEVAALAALLGRLTPGDEV